MIIYAIIGIIRVIQIFDVIAIALDSADVVKKSIIGPPAFHRGSIIMEIHVWCSRLIQVTNTRTINLHSIGGNSRNRDGIRLKRAVTIVIILCLDGFYWRICQV